MPAAAVVFSPRYEADLGDHVFPVAKYRMVRERLQTKLPSGAFRLPASYGRKVLERVHEPAYLEALFALRPVPAVVSSELPIDAPILDWFGTAVDGTLTTVEEALRRGACFHIGGGFHHAYPDHAEGFCYLNDVAVAARYALDMGRATRVTVVDLDVHQGNGTAAVFREESRVFTFSMHQERNFPASKETGDLDLGLPDGITDEAYLHLLEDALQTSVIEIAPELVLYVAGADPYREDRLGGLGLTMEGLRERDRRVFRACRRAGAKVAVCLAGGYAVRTEDTATVHVHTAEEMLAVWPWEPGGKDA